MAQRDYKGVLEKILIGFLLPESLLGSLKFEYFTDVDKRHISSTNLLERINREIRRRSRVVGVFRLFTPN